MLYDAIFLASNELMQKQEGRKAHFLLPDCDDTGIKETRDTANQGGGLAVLGGSGGTTVTLTACNIAGNRALIGAIEDKLRRDNGIDVGRGMRAMVTCGA